MTLRELEELKVKLSDEAYNLKQNSSRLTHISSICRLAFQQGFEACMPMLMETINALTRIKVAEGSYAENLEIQPEGGPIYFNLDAEDMQRLASMSLARIATYEELKHDY